MTREAVQGNCIGEIHHALQKLHSYESSLLSRNTERIASIKSEKDHFFSVLVSSNDSVSKGVSFAHNSHLESPERGMGQMSPSNESVLITKVIDLEEMLNVGELSN